MTFPVILFGDIVADIAIYLRAHPMMSGVDVVTTMTGYERGDRNLYLNRTGGTRDRFFDSATIMMESRGRDQDDAYDIAQLSRAISWTAPNSVGGVVRVEDVSGPLRWDDDVHAEIFYRYSMRFVSKGDEAN